MSRYVRTSNSVGPTVADALRKKYDVIEFIGGDEPRVVTLLRDVYITEAVDLTLSLKAAGRHGMVVDAH